jgi:hypothetical protein
MAVTVDLARMPGPGVLVELTFTNDTDADVWLARPRIETERMEGDFFEFMPQHNCRYLGIQVKRRGYSPDQVAVLRPGGTLSAIVDLDVLYDLPASSGVTVRYCAYHPTERPTDVCSGWVELRPRHGYPLVGPRPCQSNDK